MKLIASFGLFVLTASPAFAANVDTGPNGHGPLPPRAIEKPAPLILSQQHGSWFIPPPAILLGAMNHVALMAQDDPSDKSVPLRFGVERAVNVSLADGQWVNVDGGRIWSVEVDAMNAVNSRLHLSGLDMAEGQELAIVSPDEESQQMNGILERQGNFGNGEAFGLFAPGGRQRIEWFVPEGQSPTAVPFSAVAYSYGYRDVMDTSTSEAGCSIDPACYSAWLNETSACAKLLFTENGGSYTCTGQLVATTAADETPYLSTANHCFSTQTVANTLQAYFFKRAATCNGTAAAGTMVSTADLAATWLASDCTLLTIKGALPTGVYWVGWSNANPANGTASTGIHHPAASNFNAPQAISFANKAATSAFCGSGNNWSAMSWTSGITEGGSSGSAIYQNSDHKLYGVLTCGSSGCTNTTGQDGYGRWDVAVNAPASNFATLLAAGSDDTLDQNDTCAAAKAVSAGTYSNLVVKRLDEDWYSIPVVSGATLTVSMTFTHAYGDIDVQLFETCGGAVLLDRNANTNNESFTFTNNTASNAILMRVYLASGTRNTYSLTFSSSVPTPANDSCATATATGVASLSISNVNATDAPPALPASCDEGNGVVISKDLWYKFTAPSAGRAVASTCGTATFDSRIVIYPGTACPDSTTAVTACSDNGAGCSGSTSYVRWQASVGSVWYVRVGSANTTGGTGTLSLSMQPNCTGDLSNNGNVAGDDLGIMLSYWGVGGPADLNGDGTTNGADLGILLAAWGACP